MQVVRCVLSGSYRRDLAGLKRQYEELVANHCQVLSPHRMSFVNHDSEFVKDEAEVDLSAAEIEQHHLMAIKQADFVWLYCPNGYVGVSAAMEIGYAKALGKPVFSNNIPDEVVFDKLVAVVPSVYAAINILC